MTDPEQIPEPFVFNPLKHHLHFIRSFAITKLEASDADLGTTVSQIKRTGTSVTDIYKGNLTVQELCKEIRSFLLRNKIIGKEEFAAWNGTGYSDYRPVTLSDHSVWMLKYHNNNKRFVHIFPARTGSFSFRIKANTLKSALLYYILIGKDYVTREDLNKARSFLDLSPIRTTADADAITEMIEVLRQPVL